MEYIYYFVFILLIIFAIKIKQNFVVFLPLANIILDSSFSVFETLSLATYLRPLLYLILFYNFRKYLFKLNWYKPIYNFLFLSLFLVMFSSEFFYSLKGFTQVSISMLTGVLGYIYFDNAIKISRLSKVLILCLFLSSLFTFIGYAFGIGRVLEYTMFSEELEEESVGLLGSSGMYSAAFIIGVFPYIISFINKKILKRIGIALAIITYIFILLNVRRTAIAIPLIGLLIYAIYIPNKGKVVSTLVAIGSVLIILSPLYADKLIERFTFRQEQGRFEEDFYKTEGRFVETINVYEEVFSFQDPILSLFGERIFASGRKKGERLRRMLHSDVAVLLYGTGIIGSIFYLLIYLKLFKLIHWSFSKHKYLAHIKGGFYSVIFISFLASLNGSVQLVSLRSLIFLFIGIIIRQYQIYKHNQIQVERTISYNNYQ